MNKFYYGFLFYILLSIAPIAYGQNSPSFQYKNCFISDEESPYYPGYITPTNGGTGALLVEVLQNKVSALNKPYWTYTVSCPGYVYVDFIDSFPVYQVDKVKEFWRDARPSYVSSKVEVTVTPLDNTSGPILHGMFDVMNNVIVGGGVRQRYRNIYADKLTKVRVRFDIHPFYYYSNYYDKNYKWELYTPNTSWVSVTSSQGLIKGGWIYPYMFSPNNSCVLDAYKTVISPAIVDFGNVGKNEIEAGNVLSKSFSIDITRNKGSCGEITASPKIYLLPQDEYDRNNIYLDNGLMMTFKNENNRLVPLAEAYNLGKVSNNKLKKTIHVELKKGTRGKAIKSGPFSSTVIYLMEYY